MGFRDDIANYAEAKLGVHRTFLFELFDDDQTNDDWSVILKLHAFLETACTERLERTLGDRGSDYIASLHMGGRSGKVALLEALGILPETDGDYLRAFGTLRNRLIHRVKNVGVNIAEAMAARDKELESPLASVGALVIPRLPPHTQDGKESLNAQETWRRAPVLGIWWVGLTIVHALAQ